MLPHLSLRGAASSSCCFAEIAQRRRMWKLNQRFLDAYTKPTQRRTNDDGSHLRQQESAIETVWNCGGPGVGVTKGFVKKFV